MMANIITGCLSNVASKHTVWEHTVHTQTCVWGWVRERDCELAFIKILECWGRLMKVIGEGVIF